MPLIESGIRFKRRARIEITAVARRRIWETHCGRYRIVLSQSLFCKNLPREKRLADVVYAQALRGQSWDILSRHRQRGPAMQACLRDARLSLKQEVR